MDFKFGFLRFFLFNWVYLMWVCVFLGVVLGECLEIDLIFDVFMIILDK